MPPIAVKPLPQESLVRRCDLSHVEFKTTDDLADVDPMSMQKRAADAIGFGSEVSAKGFNLYVVDVSRDSVDDAVKAMLHQQAGTAQAPDDWIYLNNFETPHRPQAMRLPAGRGPGFRDAMRDFIEDLKAAIPAAFESDDFQTRRAAIDHAFSEKQENAFRELQEEAGGKGIAVIRTPFGFTLAPVKDGEVIRPDAFAALPQEKRDELQQAIKGLEAKLEAVLRAIPEWDKERRQNLRKLAQETTQNAIGALVEELKAAFADLPQVQAHLDAVRQSLVDNMAFLLAAQQSSEEESDGGFRAAISFERYEVNLLVTQPEGQGGPVVEELHPTLGNLVGRVENLARQGMLVTDFRLIKPGALHRANGGFLLLDARSLLTEPFSWAALKRALRSREIRIESAVDLLSLTSTVTLQPDPIPLNVKVVLFGERLLYYLLSALDPEFREYFKVFADFDDSLDRTADSESAYAHLIATLARQKSVLALDRDAVATVVERSARLAQDAQKLSLVVEEIGDLLVEADYWAQKEGRKVLGRAHVQRAIDEQIERASRLRDQMQQSILRDLALIDTTGATVGQVNGLSVLQLGGYSFGRPSRITARVSPGAGKVVDIEREVELGGPIHSKGVLILSGFVSGRYAQEAPISLLASLVFEQSYGGVEGDSASSAELYALLSALADAPLRQDLAVTGSVNQLGQVQVIGGVNEKIEGFFDLCNARGLTGNQGVLIPKGNVQHLMLRQDVIDACAAGRFGVYPIASIDEGLALMTGKAVGERGSDGKFPDGSVNRLVEDRLRKFAEARKPFGGDAGRQTR